MSPPQHEIDDPDHAGAGVTRSQDPLPIAYREQRAELYETRAALGEAVHTLRLELIQRSKDNANLQHEIDRLRAREAELDDLLRQVTNMKVVRWSAWPRRLVYRFRGRG